MVGKIILRVVLILVAIGLGIGAAYAVNQRLQSSITTNGPLRNGQGIYPYGNNGRMRPGPWGQNPWEQNPWRQNPQRQNPNFGPGVQVVPPGRFAGQGMDGNRFGMNSIGPGMMQNWGYPDSGRSGMGNQMLVPGAAGDMSWGWMRGSATPAQ